MNLWQRLHLAWLAFKGERFVLMLEDWHLYERLPGKYACDRCKWEQDNTEMGPRAEYCMTTTVAHLEISGQDHLHVCWRCYVTILGQELDRRAPRFAERG